MGEILHFRRPARLTVTSKHRSPFVCRLSTDEGIEGTAHPGAVQLVFANGQEIWLSPAAVLALVPLAYAAKGMERRG